MGHGCGIRRTQALQTGYVSREFEDFPVVNLVNHSHIRVGLV
jgi:hypothetical protein